METNKNPFPDVELFPRLSAVGRFLFRLATPFHSEPFDAMSDHYRGGSAMLDRELYDRPGQIGSVPAQPTLFEMRNEAQ